MERVRKGRAIFRVESPGAFEGAAGGSEPKPPPVPGTPSTQVNSQVNGEGSEANLPGFGSAEGTGSGLPSLTESGGGIC